MTILVGLAGVTGQFGEFLASKLLDKENVKIRGFCRNQAKVSQSLRSSPRFEVVEGGAYDKKQVGNFVRGCDIVVCCYLGDDDLMIEGQKVLIDACEEKRVPRYMASDWCLDYTKLQLGQLFTKDPMKHVMAYLETKEFVRGVHVFIGIFMETFFSPYFGIYDPQTHTLSHWGNPGVVFESTSYGNAAEFTAQVVLDKEAVGVQRFIGDTKSMDDIALVYKKVYGIKPKVVVKGSAKELHDVMWGVRNQPSSQPHQYMAMFYQYYMINEQTYVGPYLQNLKYPEVQALSFENFMKSVPLNQLPVVYSNPVTERL